MKLFEIGVKSKNAPEIKLPSYSVSAPSAVGACYYAVEEAKKDFPQYGKEFVVNEITEVAA